MKALATPFFSFFAPPLPKEPVLPPTYHGTPLYRIVFFALYAIGLTAGILALQGNLTSLPHDLYHFVHQVDWLIAGSIAAAAIILTGGALILIRKVMHKKERLTEAPLGKLSGDDHWIAASFTPINNQAYRSCYIDISSLDEEKSGKAYLYSCKQENEHYSVAFVVSVFIPVRFFGETLYHLVRIPIIPFYILGCMAAQKKWEGKSFHFSDIPSEIAKSFLKICQAPYYATAMFFAALYALCDPLNGRKLGAALERDWNDDVSRAEGFGSLAGPFSLWRWEGWGVPGELGKNGYYLAACWQPIGVAYYEKGKIVKVESLTKAVDPDYGDFYTLVTQQEVTE